MSEKAGNTTTRFSVFVLWIILALVYSSLCYDYIRAGNADKKLDDYLQYVVVVCGDDHRPNKEVRSLVLIRARDLKIDLHPDQVNIMGAGQSLKILVTYDVAINLPVIQKTIYQKVFDHKAQYRIIR
jgi:hypothetical protein